MPRVNPEILRWARETAGLSLEEATQKLKINEARGVPAVDRLRALETGEQEPTRPMVLKMAKQYHRPLLTFYMSAPPRKGDRGQDFRSLPDGYSESDDALLDALIRDVQARQSMVRSILEDEEDAEPLWFVGSAVISDGMPAILTSIRDTLQLNISLEQVPVASMPVKGLRVKIGYSSRLQAVCYFILVNFLLIWVGSAPLQCGDCKY
jgi:transcriptional regulator with XRE-family HTH domain